MNKKDAKLWLTIGIALICGFISSIGFGILAPLFALRMDDFGLSASVIGVLVTIAGIAPLILTPFVPRVLQKIATMKALFIAIALNSCLYFALLWVKDPWLWTLMRFGFAITGTFLFIASESIMLEMVPENLRGQVLGFYAVIFYGGIGLGGAMISYFGHQSNMTIIIAFIINILVIPAFLLKTRETTKPHSEGQKFFEIYHLIFLTPAIFMPAFAIGWLETVALNLFPVWVRQLNHPDTLAGMILSAAAIGNIILQWPLGLLGDKIGRKNVLMLISLCGFILPLFLLLNLSPNHILLVICLWSGFVTGFYVMGLMGVAEAFKANRIAMANAAFGATYCIGQLFAPIMGGALMDAIGANALVLSLSIIALFPVISLVWSEKTAKLG